MRFLKHIQRQKIWRRFRIWAAVIFLSLNLISFLGVWTLTHFRAAGQWGLGLPRSMNSRTPADIGLNFTTQRLAIGKREWLESWIIPASGTPSRGTVLLFPGKGGNKSTQLLAPAQAFHDLGYDVVLVDFRGAGGSSGNTSTIGIREAKDVAIALHEARNQHLSPPFVLYGVSMGSAAILRAIAHEHITPDAIVIELPFARLLDTVRSRLRAIFLPAFPLAEFSVFWGSLQHGVNALTHNPETYAKQVRCPTLIFHGKFDPWTTIGEIEEIYRNLAGSKRLAIFPNTGHALLVTVDKALWTQYASEFLQRFH